ncbi:MAG TPA: ISAs1 family transposase [Tepidisphaeraceae bacterium]|nr:ISAs1 family transposase [Tepidisphaeraceae bacterium]
MDGRATGGILRAFRDMPDPRAANVTHKLHDLIVIAACAVICGAGGWAEVEVFGNSKLAWFRTFLDLPGGVPSHDTFGRVFSRLDPDAFERRFVAWVTALAGPSGGRLVAVDGKAIRRSFEHAWDASGMAHLVSAFVDANRVVFAQVAVAGKSNEIEAIPRLLALLDLEGATVTVDAIGCQTEVARQVVDAGGHYVLAVKDNQPTLHAKVRALLDEAILDGFDGMSHGRHAETCGGHGRVETRRAWVTDEVRWLGDDLLARWPGLAAVAAVECERAVAGGARSVERRYFVTSRPGADAAALLAAVRGHWAVENKLHWQLDVSFREDECRVRVGHGAENLSRLRRLALNLLKRDRSAKIGIAGKRLKAGWDEHYLLRLLTS